jgi:C4-dicarboxylate transporter DctQ subunit
MNQKPTSKLGEVINSLEETGIAICLGLMTVITFANVVARYVFNDNILWALEMTVFLFAWLVLLGASYGVKKQIHIGVDVLLNVFPPYIRKILGLIAVGTCLVFSLLLLKGSWDYWYPFATERAWLETDDIPIPEFLQFISAWFLEDGERYEKLPRFIPYFALPLGLALITFRFIQQAWRIATGEIDKIIASHEVEDELEELQASKSEQEQINEQEEIK